MKQTLCAVIVFLSLVSLCALCGPPVYQLTDLQPTQTGQKGSLSLVSGAGPYGEDIHNVSLEVIEYTKNIVRVRLFSERNDRWEVPDVVQIADPASKPSTTNYEVSMTHYPFGFSIVRVSDRVVVFNSTAKQSSKFSNMVFEDHYLSIGTTLEVSSQPNIYGFGERIHSFRLDPTGKTYTMFTADHGNNPDTNLYGVHPFYLEMRNGKAHGAFMLNSNAMDAIINLDSIEFKMIGGIFDMFFFMGDTPDEVVAQYHDVIGHPNLIPYWVLGFHQCRWGYKNLDEVKSVVANYSAHDLPLETMWSDIDYMDQYKLFTTDPVNYPAQKMGDFVKELHSNGQKYIVIVDPGVKVEDGYHMYEDGLKRKVYIMDKDNTQPIRNRVWPGITVFPDFTNPDANAFWSDYIEEFLNIVPVDGLWIDMNEIDGFCDNSCNTTNTAKSGTNAFDPDNPPYVPGGESLVKNTIGLSAHCHSTLNYNVHSMYGFMEGRATSTALEKLTNKRSVVISRSTYAGHGYKASHWLGDNFSTFKSMETSIPGILNFNMFGIPLVGADICGFNGNSNEELCTRWMELGSFYMFSRNHNSVDMNPQEPYRFSDAMTNIVRIMLNNRLALSPFYYTLMFDAHLQGGMVTRPLFFEYSSGEDEVILEVDHQFIIGNALMVSPVLTSGSTSVDAYIPKDLWYDYWTGTMLDKAGWTTLDAPIDHINVHIRGGTIIPRYLPGKTTDETRKNPMNLLVALDASGNAVGNLILDDGVDLGTADGGKFTRIMFHVTKSGSVSSLLSSFMEKGYPVDTIVGEVFVLGCDVASDVTVDGKRISSFTFDKVAKVLHISSISVQLSSTINIQWK